MKKVFLYIYQGDTKSERLCVDLDDLAEYKDAHDNDDDDDKPSRIQYQTLADPIQLYYFLQRLERDEVYRERFYKTICASDSNTIKFKLRETKLDTIDYNWNEKMCLLAHEKCEVDHTLSWLSTLGGAFSALGDYFVNMAETAGKISMHQLQLACRLGDPTVASRCILYYSLSLIQRKQFRSAKNMIRSEYLNAVNNPVRDERLIKMCQGIWAKLQYEKSLHKNKLLKFH